MYLKNRILALIVVVSTLISNINAQQSNTMYFMELMPQANQLNPAFQIPCKLYVSFPLLGNTFIHYSNSGFAINDLITQNGTNAQLNTSFFLENQEKSQLINFWTNINLLSVGYKYKKTYFSFYLNERIEADINYQNQLFAFAILGNGAYLDKKVTINGPGISLLHYREYSFGVSQVWDEQFTFGAKFKLLFGKANLYTPTLKTSWLTDANNFNIDLNAQSKVNMSLPLILELNNNLITGTTVQDDPIAYLLNRKNVGIALDAGIVYKIDDKTTVAASILDFGGFFWRSNPYVLEANGHFNYKGIQFGNNTLNFSQARLLSDTLQTLYNVSINPSSYVSPLSPKVFIGGQRTIYKWLNLSALAKAEIYRVKIHPSLTLGTNFIVSRNFSSTISYTVANSKFNNLGAGLCFRVPGFGFYLISDNLYGMAKYRSTRLLNFQFGIDMMFGCGKKKITNEKMMNIPGCKYLNEMNKKNKFYERFKKKRKKQEK
jgi:hypothetical protein